MGKPLRVLIVEDSEDDTELLLRELRRGGYDVAFERVDTSEAMTAALDGQSWDIAIVDYNLPQFSGLDALALFQEKCLDLPFIIVSGTVGEDTAVEAVKAGATDYVMKDRLVRFVPAVERSLREAEERRQRRRTEVELKQSTEQLSLLFGSMPIIPYMAGAGKGDAGITYIAGTVTDITGYKPENFTSDKAFWVDRVHPKDAPRVFEDFRKFSEKEYQEHEYRWRVADGSYRWFNDLFHLVKLPDGTTKVIGVLHDVTERQQTDEELKALTESLEQRVAEQTAQLAESEELFRNMSAAAQDAIITADSEECIS
ncbi:MAG: PAS domain-containing protein, partial [Candidatus Brocadiales bacterium]